MPKKTLPILTLAAMLLSPAALAIPQVGAEFPTVEATDITGQGHHTRELRGHPTLVLLGSDSDAGDALRAWGEIANRRLPPGAERLIVMAMHLVFIIPTATARSMARNQTPERFWHQSWIDTGGTLRERVGVPESEVPFVFVLNSEGRVVASVHSLAGAPGTEQIWRALDREARDH